MSLYNIKLLQDKINGLTKEYNYSNNNKDSKNNVDKGKAENYNNRSDDSSDINNNNFRDSDSSNDNKGNKAYKYIGQQESPAPINSGLKLKCTAKYYL